jgi:hypothetical protein
MKCIYEIKYEVRWASKEPDKWEEQFAKVFADKDALTAVEKARETALKQSRLDDNGRQEQCVDFRLREVTLLAQADL